MTRAGDSQRRWSAEEDAAVMDAARRNRTFGQTAADYDPAHQRRGPDAYARRLEEVAFGFDRTLDAVRARASRLGARSQ